MEIVTTSIRINAPHQKVLAAFTTAEGTRGWWAQDCDVGRKVGEKAVYRFGAVEVAFRIDRLDARGIEMTCVGHRNFPDWKNTHLTLRAVPDGDGTHFDLLHDGYPEKNETHAICSRDWRHYVKQLKHCVEAGHRAEAGAGGVA